MPHQCTNCDRTFEDGSKQMLGGCPDCGGNKFQFLPRRSVGRRSDTVMGGNPAGSSTMDATHDDEDGDIIEAPAEPIVPNARIEDRAQASARRSVVTKDELPPAEGSRGGEEPAPPPQASERPDLATLRQELNEQFESIKILKPGQYELNLMELYDREEYIIALEEDGRYVIEVPDTWSETGGVQ